MQEVICSKRNTDNLLIKRDILLVDVNYAQQFESGHYSPIIFMRTRFLLPPSNSP